MDQPPTQKKEVPPTGAGSATLGAAAGEAGAPGHAHFQEAGGALPPQGPETEVWAGRTHWKHFAGRLLLWLVANAVAAALVVAVARQTDALAARGATWTILILLLVSGFIVVGGIMLKVLGTRYRLTSQRLFIERGILNRTVDQTELIRVDDVRMYKPLMDRILGLGSVAIVTSDATDRETLIDGIADPDAVAEAVRSQMRLLRRKSVFVENI